MGKTMRIDLNWMQGHAQRQTGSLQGEMNIAEWNLHLQIDRRIVSNEYARYVFKGIVE